MASNDQKAAKIRAALTQLDPADDKHWTDDGLPRESAVRTFANDQNISRKDIQDAHPGFQRHPQKPEANVDPLSGEPEAPISDEAKAAARLMAPPDGSTTLEGNADPTKNTGELMTDEEVRLLLEQRVKDATQAIADRQQDIRDANKALIDAQNHLQAVREDFTREFPPLTQAQNIKQYIASEQASRAAAYHPGSNLAPGSQVDAAMQRSNSRGWRRPSRNGPVQTGAAKVA